MTFRIDQLSLDALVASAIGPVFWADKPADPEAQIVNAASQPRQLSIDARYGFRYCCKNRLGPLQIGLCVTPLIAETSDARGSLPQHTGSTRILARDRQIPFGAKVVREGAADGFGAGWCGVAKIGDPGVERRERVGMQPNCDRSGVHPGTSAAFLFGFCH
ncbi:hypothetical protein [Lichenibacterium dinghuense]|uniref:hypothetical protein n=1 Tax=Lichenibacterium dinghuense TaxID=2895977 RepID=UPI001F3EDB26|nr:hypothetical protein [Lichenibacterium sp. 6Y81]